MIDRRRLRGRSRVARYCFRVGRAGGVRAGLRLSGFGGVVASTSPRSRSRPDHRRRRDDLGAARRRQVERAGLILDIDSPGGGAEGSERIYDAIRDVAKTKPTVAVVGSLGASGAYIAAIAADRIFVHQNSLVGSIGVLAQYPNVSGLLDKLGVKYETIKSSPLKAAPNGLEPTSDAARAAIAAIIEDSFAWFKGLVRERRGMNDDELARFDDGRVFTGRQSLPLKLADAFGGEREAIEWLNADKGVPKNLPVRDYTPGSGFAGFKLEEPRPARPSPRFGRDLSASRSVDGLMSVWQMTTGN